MKPLRVALAAIALSSSGVATAAEGSGSSSSKPPAKLPSFVTFRDLTGHHPESVTDPMKVKTARSSSFLSSRDLGGHFPEPATDLAKPFGKSDHWTPPKPYLKLPSEKRRPIEQLLSQERRPTIHEVTKVVKESFGEFPKENPFGHAHLRSDAHHIADLIAQLEHAYPGGTWLPLGRDAVLIADLLDGFYRSIGQPDRVRRLDASGTSFPHYRDATPETYEKDRPIIHGFLKTNGLDFDNIDKAHPFIMIDVTSYSRTSQSTQLMRSAYRTWALKGRDPKALFDKVNFVGIPQGMTRFRISEHANIDAFKAELKDRTTSDGPPDILYLDGPTHRLTYTDAWHEMFHKFSDDGEGNVTAKPGAPTSESSRLKVLAELYETATLTSSPELLSKVKEAAAKKYGYEFPLQRTEQLTRYARPVRAKEPAPSTRSLSDAGARVRQSTSTFLEALKHQLTKNPTVGKAGEFVEDMAGMWMRGTATNGEVKEMVAEIQKHVDLRSAAFEPTMGRLSDRYYGFAKVIRQALYDLRKSQD